MIRCRKTCLIDSNYIENRIKECLGKKKKFITIIKNESSSDLLEIEFQFLYIYIIRLQYNRGD